MSKDKAKKSTKITFHYIKADNFHSILSSGVIGGVTVNSLIDMNFFSDRVTIPQSLTFEVEQSGNIGQELNRETKEGTVREVQFGVLMDIPTAKSLIEWLVNKVDIIETIQKKK